MTLTMQAPADEILKYRRALRLLARAIGWAAGGAQNSERKESKMLNKTKQSDRAPNANERQEDCYCSALPKGSGLCLPCYTRWLAGSPRLAERPPPAIEHVGPRRDAC